MDERNVGVDKRPEEDTTEAPLTIEQEIQRLLNRFSAESPSGTPDFILAKMFEQGRGYFVLPDKEPTEAKEPTDREEDSSPPRPIDMKYGECYIPNGNFEDGEPIFILRARDVYAPATIEKYANLCEDGNSTLKHVQGVNRVHKNFTAWQRQHGMKYPD
jgi:hypothetical protein